MLFPKTTIVLTTTVNVKHNLSFLFQTDKQSRLSLYLKSIHQWMRSTSFNIVVVENSGYAFDELIEYRSTEPFKHRFELITFTERDIPEAAYLRDNTHKGASEIFAINYAYYHSRLLPKSDFIIKVTGRFFVSELESFLSLYDLHICDGLSQNNPMRCEIVGSHMKWFHKIFNPFLINKKGNYDGHVENIYRTRLSYLDNVIKCTVFDIEPTPRGGFDECFKEL